MKQILLAFGAVLLTLLAFYLLSNKYDLKQNIGNEKVSGDFYFEMEGGIKNGEEKEMVMKIKADDRKIVKFSTAFNFEPLNMKILSGEINKEIFDRGGEIKIDQGMGNVEINGENGDVSKLKDGEIVVAKFKIQGTKKGTGMIYMTKRPEVYILKEGQIVQDENFYMPNFSVNFL
ncbi:hypothetical protein KBB92_02200 [Candidatus Shapirobacteria bacterium]|jgi:hypothetical protein|nr:hypothetical protein [Candidatus Shapirobacteria bacterium]